MLFRSTSDIFKDKSEIFSYKDVNNVIDALPESKIWDYSREMQIEDVDIWEVIYENINNNGIYASWLPYAEFYMIIEDGIVETFYGPGSQSKIKSFIKQKNIPLGFNKIWVDTDDMWLYEN